MHTPIRRSLLSLFSLVACACSTVATAPDAPDPSTPPRGEALGRAVVGLWHGTAHDGSDTTEEVRLTLGADGRYELAAGAVSSAQSWSVHDGGIYLEEDDNDTLTDGGICFVPTLIAHDHIEGQWSWGRSATDCDDATYAVVLDRAAENE